MKTYIEKDLASTLPKKAYVEVNKTSHKILKVYIGVNGKSKLIYIDEDELTNK